MAWTITFKNRKNETCVVSIAGGTGTLTPAAEPFRVQMDDDDDIFKPVRTSSGNIKIVDANISTIKSIMCATPLERAVTLTVTTASGTTTTAWMGFVKCEAFEQTLFGYNEEFSIPIMDCLSALEGVYVDDTNWSSNIKSISSVFDYMWDKIGIDDSNVEYPDDSYLNAEINKLNYVEFRDAKNCILNGNVMTCYDGKSYMTILEDVCKLYGWTAMQANGSLYFLKMDKSFESPVTFDNSAYITTDHTMGIVRGKKSVKVTGSVNANTSSIFSFQDALSYKNLSGEKVIKITNSVWYSSYGGKNCFEYPLTKLSGRPIATFNSLPSGEAMEHYNWSGSTALGCSLEEEGWADSSYSTDDSIVSPCVIMRRGDNTNYGRIVTFYLPFKSSEMDARRLKVTFDVKVKTDPKLEWQSSPCRILYRNGYKGSSSEWKTIHCVDGAVEVHPPVDIISFSLAPEGLESSPVYVRISNVQVKYYDETAINTYGAELFEKKSEYSKEIKIGGGFTDDYSIDCNLVGGRSIDSDIPVPGGGSQSKMLYGYGVVKNCPISKPEETLCNRAYNYYSQSRSRACIIIENSKPLNPDCSVSLSGTTYNIIAQELNARDCELKLTLQECISYVESSTGDDSSSGGDYPDNDQASGNEDNYGDDSDYGDYDGPDYPDYDYE